MEALRPLGIVKEIIEDIGQEITYAYDDLVFVKHNDFLLQFEKSPEELGLYFNTECAPDEADAIAAKLVPASAVKGLSVNRKGTYTMSEAEDNNLKITFNT
ncbi:MAG: hypothetical protein LWW75_07390 [Chlorobiales bacterium]|nr:hypothetical protein [Chlorobiales bacterium]